LLALQRSEITKIVTLLSKAYNDAPTATYNPNIYSVAPYDWSKVKFSPGNKSLAYILHVEEGWTDVRMIEEIGKGNSDIRIYPLCRPQSRALTSALRYRHGLDHAIGNASFKIELSEKWLRKKLKFSEFQKKGGVDYATKLVATVSYGQSKFIGRDDIWFRPMCQELGFDVKKSFFDTFLIALFVVCVDPELLKSSTKSIKGTWGANQNKFKVKKIWIDVVKKAEMENAEKKYPETFKLLKTILPSVLN